MALLAFQMPKQVVLQDQSDTFGRFEFAPLEPGYGITIGNAIRRILLSALEGYAINSVKIDNVDHEFASIPGVLEDVTNIILNLKKLRLKRLSDASEEETVIIKVQNTTIFTAADISSELSNFEVLNKDQVICHLDKSVSFTVQLTIVKGRSWVPAEEIAGTFEDVQQIAIDAIFTPIRQVKYVVENTRVEQRTDYDKLSLEITTDGSITPEEALRGAAEILISHFSLCLEDYEIIEKEPEENASEELNQDSIHIMQLLRTPLSELDLSVRALNCLKAANVETLGELVKYSRAELLKFRNFGKKSLTELEELLGKLNLDFGMDVAKYNLDKEEE